MNEVSQVKIIDFDKKFIDDFKKLSYEWLIEYHLLEPEDERIINDPVGVILDQGGCIYFAELDGKVVGTISLIKVDQTTYEVAKMGVTKAYQGMKIGKQLLEWILNVARQQGAKKLLIYSNSQLKTALKMYEKYGFQLVPFTQDKYDTADIKMELQF